MNYSIIKNANVLKKKIIKYLNPIVTTSTGHNIKKIVKTVSMRVPEIFKNTEPSNKISKLDKAEKKRVFIIGGGSSLTGFNFGLLDNEDVIAVNKSIEHVKYAKYFITMDYTFISSPGKLTNSNFDIIKNKSEFNYFIINTEHPYIKNIEGVYTDTRSNLKYKDLYKFTGVIESKKTYDISTGFGETIKEFSHGQNSGYCALQLALLLGYDEIYLLGFDLNTNLAQTHFHNGYKQDKNKFYKNLINYRAFFLKSLQYCKSKDKIKSCSSISFLNNFIEYSKIENLLNIKQVEPKELEPVQENKPVNASDLRDLIVVGYYTIDTPYEKEAEGLINSCKKLNLVHDIIGVPNFGGWQSNTRFKAKFMQNMILKYPGKNLLYVDCDAVIHSRPTLFANYDYDIGIRYQDFRWRKNECLSGTIFMNANERTLALCKRWQEINESEGKDAKTMEQWNLDKAIQEGIKSKGLKFNNFGPEYTYIFDSMKAIYPNIRPVIEHFQASRRLKGKV